MDQKPLGGGTTKPLPRKMRFAPKPPPKREPKLVLPKPEKNEIDRDDAKEEHLLRRLNETSVGKEKVERKAASVEVAFGFKGSSNSNRSYSAHKRINGNQGSSSNGGAEGVDKEYKEPWDYYTNYPVTLPMRRPYSGNPELLDKEEFGHPENSAFDENEINTAEELGLLDDGMENNMIFFQFPPSLPSIIQSANSKVPDPANNGKAATSSGTSQQHCNLESLPAGLMGKMLVYKSGAVKLKLGDTLYDVSAGVTSTMAQDVFAIDKEHQHCCNLGELNKCAVVTPDIDSMLDAVDDS